MAAPAPLTDADPARIGEYTLLGRLGQGGQGVVYLGTGPDGEQVAVKTLHGDALDLPGLRAQLAEEVETARRVARFCTAQVLAADLDADPPHVVSEYVEGQSLHAVVRGQGALNGAALERLAVGTLTALAAIHQAGIVHRDFKPGNVLMAPGGPRVIDFGIARALEGTAILTSRIAGTPAYMAPEQITGGPLGPAVDLFAWGATIVYAANGRGPFGHDSLKAVVNRVISDDPDLGELDGPLREIAEHCLDKDPSRRPTAAEALMRVLGVESAPPPEEPATDTAVPVAHQTLVAGAIAAADTGAQESAAAEIYRSYPSVSPPVPGPGAPPPPAQAPPVTPPGHPYPTGGQRPPYPYPTGPQGHGHPGPAYPPVPSGPQRPHPPVQQHWAPPPGPPPRQPMPPQYPGQPPYGQQPANGTGTGTVIGIIGAVVVAGLLVFVLVIAAISNLG